MDRNEKPRKLVDNIMFILHGLMDGNINCTFNRFHCVMGADICTLFDDFRSLVYGRLLHSVFLSVQVLKILYRATRNRQF